MSNQNFRDHEETIFSEATFFHAIVNQVSDMVVVCDTHGTVLFVNPSAINAYGYTRDEFLCLKINNLCPLEMQHELNEKIEETRKHSVVFCCVNLRRNGEVFHIESNLQRSYFGKEEVIVSVARDITNISFAEVERKKDEEMFYKVFHISPGSGTISRLKDGLFKEVNDEFLRTSGYIRAEVIGKTSSDLNLWLNPDDRTYITSQIKAFGEVKNYESYFRNKEGNVDCGLLSASVIHYKGDDCMITNIRTITERKKMEEIIRLSEERFHKVFNLNPDAVSISRVDGTYIDVNEGFVKLSGFQREEVIGKKTQELELWAHDTDRDRMVTEIKRYGEVNNLEAWFVCKGHILRCGLLSARLVNINGEECFLIANRDITERKQTEETLRISEGKYRLLHEELTISQKVLQSQFDELMAMKEALQLSEEKFHQAFNLSPDAVTISRADGIYVEVNEGFVRMSGFQKEEAVGKLARDLNIWVDLNDRKQMYKGTISQGGANNLEIKFRRKDGSILDGLLSARSISFGGENYTIAVVRDITERKQAEEKLQLLIKEMYITKLKQREAELNVLRSQINPHFFNNTLNLIKAEAVLSGNKSISSIVTSLGYLLRYTMNTPKDIVSLSEEIKFVQDYLGIYKRRFMDRFSFSIDLPDELAYCLMPKLILQPIVENSFKHGLKNTESGGIIDIRIFRQEDGICFTVYDNGEGMKQEVFERLIKGIPENEEKHIGLRNVHQRLILEYGEDAGIHISSKVGRYTWVSFKIPCRYERGEAGW